MSWEKDFFCPQWNGSLKVGFATPPPLPDTLAFFLCSMHVKKLFWENKTSDLKNFSSIEWGSGDGKSGSIFISIGFWKGYSYLNFHMTV